MNRFDTLYRTWDTVYNIEKYYVIQVHAGVKNVSGGNSHEIGEVQRRFQSLFPDLEVMSSNGIGYHGYNDNNRIHFEIQGYENLADRLFGLLERDWYCKTDSLEYLTPPNIQYAKYVEDDTHINLELHFDQPIYLKDSYGCITTGVEDFLIKDFVFYPFQYNHYIIDGIELENNVFQIAFDKSNITLPDYVGYMSYKTYDTLTYIMNERCIGALTFDSVLINGGKRIGSISFAQNVSKSPYNNRLCELLESASGKVCGTIEEDLKAYEILTCYGCNASDYTTIPVNSQVTFKAANLIILRPGFHVEYGSKFHANVGNDLCAFTANNYCENQNNFFKTPDQINLPYKPVFEDDVSEFNLFPNPSNGQFELYPNKEWIGKKVNIYALDFWGRKVYSEERLLTQVNKIRIRGMAKGIYILSISNRSVCHNLKFIIR